MSSTCETSAIVESWKSSLAPRVRSYSDSLYERGHALTEDGQPVPLGPYSLPKPVADGLYELAIAERAANTLEVGLGLGLGTLALCSALLESGSPDPHHVVIEPFSHHWRNVGLRVVRESGVEALVEHIAEKSQRALPRLLDEGREFDLALIDGSHTFDDAFVDLYFSNSLVKPGGLVVVDDLWMPAIRLAVSYFVTNLGYELVPDALPQAFRWVEVRRRWRHRRGHEGTVAVLRTPAEPPEREWDSFVPFV